MAQYNQAIAQINQHLEHYQLDRQKLPSINLADNFPFTEPSAAPSATEATAEPPFDVDVTAVDATDAADATKTAAAETIPVHEPDAAATAESTPVHSHTSSTTSR
jgi:hypothetical protein